MFFLNKMARSFNQNELNSSASDERDHARQKPTYDPASLVYDMIGDKFLYIFNHDEYQDNGNFESVPPPRPGTQRDVNSLKRTFENLNFIVEIHNNLTHNDLLDKLRYICSRDHSYTSCVAIAILTHGDEGGVVYAANTKYPLSDVINYLLNEPGLAGKPKLFFIQVCKGGNTDKGKRIQIDGRASVVIPTHSDCLVMMATFEGHVAFRNWMIQDLCDVVNVHHGDKDLLQMVTIVNHRMAGRESKSNQRCYNKNKQIPETRFTLTKFLNL